MVDTKQSATTPTEPMASTTATTTSTPELKRSLTLKFEYDGQQYELSSLTTADTIGDLKAVVCSMINIDDFDRINMKTLQPTKTIDTSDGTKPLSEVFRQTRERIVVEDVLAVNTSMDFHRTPKSEFDPSTSMDQGSRPKHHKADFEEGNFSNQSTASSSMSPPSVENLMQPPNSSIPLGTENRPRKVPRDLADQVPACSSTGYLLRHPVPSNNSCLFISIHYCLTNGTVDDQIGKSMRKIIAETVASDPEKFDDAFLGKSNADYCQWILDDNNWGGAIELSILCKYYETEIVAIDVKNTILNRFGEDSHYPQRMLLLYDGIHYDPLKFQPIDESKPIQTLFPSENLEVLTLADEIAKESKQSHQFTDLQTITMMCSSCNIHLDAKSLSEHAAKTGHVDFREIQ